jgi:carboxyl-terminal processing protease
MGNQQFDLCGNIQNILHKNLYHPRLQGDALARAIDEFGAVYKNASKSERTDEVTCVNDALSTLGVSNASFWKLPSRQLGSQWSINATLSPFLDGTKEYWVFEDVVPQGLADRAQIKTGEILLAVDGKAVEREPLYQLGQSYSMTILGRDGQTTRQVSVSLPNTGPKNRPPLVEPPALSFSEPRAGVGLIRVSSFPAIIGFDFAHELSEISRRFERDGCKRLIVDLRANCGGGLGSLRLMSLLTPAKLLIGYSLSRAAKDSQTQPDRLPVIDKIPNTKLGLYIMALRFTFNKGRSIRLVTEGVGKLPFQGNITVLTNKFSRSGSEMVAAFAQRNNLARIIGSPTAGETLGAANFKVTDVHRIRIPLVGWYTGDHDILEGKGVTPDKVIRPTLNGLREGRDEVLDYALSS